jgi:anti-sigma factor RsiW
MTEGVALSCQEFVELVTDYLEGALSADETRRFEEHLEWCTWCADYIEQMRTTIALTGRLEGTGLDHAAEAVLLDVFRDWNSG